MPNYGDRSKTANWSPSGQVHSSNHKLSLINKNFVSSLIRKCTFLILFLVTFTVKKSNKSDFALIALYTKSEKTDMLF